MLLIFVILVRLLAQHKSYRLFTFIMAIVGQTSYCPFPTILLVNQRRLILMVYYVITRALSLD